VGAAQIVEVHDERLDSRFDREGGKHVQADKLRQAADRLHRHRLMEQVERLLTVDAQLPPERCSVRRERFVRLDARELTEALLQVGDAVAEVGEVLGDRQLSLCDDKEPRGLSFHVPRPEYLRDRHARVERLRKEACENDGVAVRLAQRDGAGGSSPIASLGLVVP
jgi:hypothetical protein